MNLDELDDEQRFNPSMTSQICAEHCRDYKYFGTENGDTCFCGNSLAYKDLASEWACAIQCAGNQETYEICGGSWVLSLWEKE